MSKVVKKLHQPKITIELTARDIAEIHYALHLYQAQTQSDAEEYGGWFETSLLPRVNKLNDLFSNLSYEANKP